MTENQFRELEQCCAWVVQFLKKYGNPYSMVLISADSIQMLTADMFIPISEASQDN